MDKTKFKELYAQMAARNGDVPILQNVDFYAEYYGLTRHWGEKINLTKNIKPIDFIIENIIDPALAFTALCSQHGGVLDLSRCADLGCGGGFVGINWHVLNEQGGEMVLCDSDRRKANFCRQVVRELGLKHVEIINKNVETLSHDVVFKPFTVAVTRAVWPVDKLAVIKRTLPLAGCGRFLAMVSGRQKNEVQKNLYRILYRFSKKDKEVVRYVLEIS